MTAPAAPPLAITGATLDGEVVGLRSVAGTIVALGPDVAAEPGDQILDAAGLAMIPPLVNGHTHAAMTLFRGYGSDLRLREWLEDRIWPAEARLTDDDVYWGTRLAALEMIRSGTTRFADMYWHPAAVARAVGDAGLRATVGAPLLDRGSAAGPGALRDDARRALDELASAPDTVEPSLCPHAPYTVSEASLAWIAELAAERDLPVHIHVAETVHEIEEWNASHERRLAFALDDAGILGPRTILAHACVFDDDEYELIGERGATIVTNPVSNLKLANGRIFPYRTAAAAGIPIGLGTDGAASNNSLDLLADVKVLALLQKHREDDPTTLPAHEALEVAQGRHAPLLGATQLAVGEPADLLLVRTDLPEMNPGDLVDDLVYASSSESVDTVVVAGRVLMRGRTIDGADEVVARARHHAARLLAT